MLILHGLPNGIFSRIDLIYPDFSLGSISRTGSTASQETHGLRVNPAPSIVIDEDKTPIPQSSVEAPFDELPDNYEDAAGMLVRLLCGNF